MSSVVYSIPCSCGKVYIRETTRRLEQRMSKHQMHAEKEKRGSLQLLIMHGRWTTQFYGRRRVIDRASRSGELRVKEALHIHLTPEDHEICWPGTAWLLGFHSQSSAHEAMPTTIGLGKGFPFFP